MTQHDDPLIQGIRLSEWARYISMQIEGPEMRGLRVEPDDRGEYMMWWAYLPENPFLGLHTSGPRAGSRVTMADLGWRHDEQQGREGG